MKSITTNEMLNKDFVDELISLFNAHLQGKNIVFLVERQSSENFLMVFNFAQSQGRFTDEQNFSLNYDTNILIVDESEYSAEQIIDMQIIDLNGVGIGKVDAAFLYGFSDMDYANTIMNGIVKKDNG